MYACIFFRIYLSAFFGPVTVSWVLFLFLAGRRVELVSGLARADVGLRLTHRLLPGALLPDFDKGGCGHHVKTHIRLSTSGYYVNLCVCVAVA